jgi:hypothetical protein
MKTAVEAATPLSPVPSSADAAKIDTSVRTSQRLEVCDVHFSSSSSVVSGRFY